MKYSVCVLFGLVVCRGVCAESVEAPPVMPVLNLENQSSTSDSDERAYLKLQKLGHQKNQAFVVDALSNKDTPTTKEQKLEQDTQVQHQQTYSTENHLTDQSASKNHPTEPDFKEGPVVPELDTNNAELVEHALYSSVVMENIEAVKKLLPIYETSVNPNDKTSQLLTQVAHALLATHQSDYKSAIRLYREVLARHPNLLDIRLQLAKLLYADQQDEAAKDQLVRLRSESQLSNDDKVLLDAYIAAINKRSAWEFGGGLGYAYDPNANNAPKRTTIQMNGGTWTIPEAEAAHGIHYRLTVGKSLNLKRNHYLQFHHSLSGRSYWTNHDYDEHTTKASFGWAYKDTKNELAVLPYYQRRWVGGERYNQEAGVSFDGLHWLSPRHQLSLSGKHGRESYAGRRRDFNSGQVFELGGSYLFINNARQYWSLGLTYHKKDAHDSARAYDRISLSGTWTQDWQKGLSSSLSLGIAKSDYKAADIVGIRRSDTDYSAGLSLWHRNLHFFGITPRLTVNYQDSDSNHPFYDLRKSNAFIQFHKKF